MTVDLEAQVRAYTDFLDSTLQVVEAGDVISERLDGLRHSEDPARLVVPRWAVAVAAAIGALLVVGGLAVWLRAFIEDPPPVVDEPEQTTVTTSAPEFPGSEESPTTTAAGPGDPEEAPSPGAADAPSTGIAFVAQSGGDRMIYLMDAEGDVRNLSGFSHDAFGPVWSPDGTRIAYQSSTGLYVMRGDGTAAVQLTEQQTSAPAWSPDGTRIAYLADGFYVTGVGGSDETALTGADGTSTGSVDWSPDGARIVYASTDDETSSVFVINPDGSDRRRLVDGRQPNWSPDGRLIAYETQSDAGVWDIRVMAADGSDPRPLTGASGSNRFGAAWSPDGTRLAYASASSDVEDLIDVWVVDLDGSVPTQLNEDNIAAGPPSWSPDGTQVAYPTWVELSRDEWLAARESGQLGEYEVGVRIQDADPRGGASIRPVSGNAIQVAWSPAVVADPVRTPLAVDNSFTWEVIGGEGDAEFEAATSISDVEYNGSVYVAVGEASKDAWCWHWDAPAGCGGDFDPQSQAAVWTSGDGLDWVRVTHEDAVFGARRAWMSDVAVWDGGFVAAGQHDEGVLWLSADGSTWSRNTDAAFRGGEAWALAARGSTIVVGGWSGFGPVTWASSDGVTWTRVEAPPPNGFFDLVATEEGFLGFDQLGAAWTSIDGKAWTEAPDAAIGGDGPALVIALAAGDSGYLAAGLASVPALGAGNRTDSDYVGDAKVRLWASPDGTRWRSVTDSSVLGSAETSIIAVDAAPAPWGFVAGGSNWAVQSFSADPLAPESAVWLSRDGDTWTKALDGEGIFTAGYVNAVVATDAMIVAAGHTIRISADGGRIEYGGALVWVGTLQS